MLRCGKTYFHPSIHCLMISFQVLQCCRRCKWVLSPQRIPSIVLSTLYPLYTDILADSLEIFAFCNRTTARSSALGIGGKKTHYLVVNQFTGNCSMNANLVIQILTSFRLYSCATCLLALMPVLPLIWVLLTNIMRRTNQG